MIPIYTYDPYFLYPTSYSPSHLVYPPTFYIFLHPSTFSQFVHDNIFYCPPSTELAIFTIGNFNFECLYTEFDKRQENFIFNPCYHKFEHQRLVLQFAHMDCVGKIVLTKKEMEQMILTGFKRYPDLSLTLNKVKVHICVKTNYQLMRYILSEKNRIGYFQMKRVKLNENVNKKEIIISTLNELLNIQYKPGKITPADKL